MVKAMGSNEISIEVVNFKLEIWLDALESS